MTEAEGEEAEFHFQCEFDLHSALACEPKLLHFEGWASLTVERVASADEWPTAGGSLGWLGFLGKPADSRHEHTHQALHRARHRTYVGFQQARQVIHDILDKKVN